MKDPLLNYIEENKSALNTQVPKLENWNKIESRIAKKSRTKVWLTFGGTIAAVLFVAIMLVNTNKPVDLDDGLETAFTESFIDSITIRNKRTREIEIDGGSNQVNVITGGIPGNYGDVNSGLIAFGDGRLNAYSNNWSGVDIGVYDINVDLSITGVFCGAGTSIDFDYSNDLSLKPNSNVYTSNTLPTTPSAVRYDVDHYYEQYEDFSENEFETPLNQPLSTFGIDVDGAGYSNVRRFIRGGYLPPKNAVKLEEMINYFNYDLPEPTAAHPFSITTEVMESPWRDGNLLMQVAIKGKEVEMDENQTNNIVFLIDVSGSMEESNKLPLLKKSLRLMINKMGKDDQMAIVVYAGSSGLVLPTTSNKTKIYDALDQLSAGGSTAGGEGIELAYKIAEKAFVKNGNNRVILATDGDFNVGISNDDALVKLIEEKRKTGVSLSVLGFGTGNLQSSKMEKLADNGNGNYYYIDHILEAKKVLVDQLGGTLITIAKDVKLQLEFNPEHVKSYRLIGYENRLLAAKDFEDDTKDAGDLGSGHTVVALYELVTTEDMKMQMANDLRYQKNLINPSKGLKEELAIVKFRYKKPNASKSKLIEVIVKNEQEIIPSKNIQFASAVAAFGMLIRESSYCGTASFDEILKRAKENKGADPFGYRGEFIQMVEAGKLLMEEYKLK